MKKISISLMMIFSLFVVSSAYILLRLALVYSADTAKININTASVEELTELPGIGEVTAQNIVDHREKNDKFKSIEGLKDVKGIGDAKYEKVKDLITTE